MTEPRFITELRKCHPGDMLRAPTQETNPDRKWMGTPIGAFLEEWDRLTASRDRYKQMAELLEDTLRRMPTP